MTTAKELLDRYKALNAELSDKDAFIKRTKEHIARVHKNMLLFVGYLTQDEPTALTMDILDDRGRAHDADKFTPENIKGYIAINNYYAVKNAGGEITKEIQKAYDDAISTSGRHVYGNRHHPEFFEKQSGINSMKLLDLIEMVSDWTAMAQELKQDNGSCIGWYKKVIVDKFRADEVTQAKVLGLIRYLDKKNGLNIIKN